MSFILAQKAYLKILVSVQQPVPCIVIIIPPDLEQDYISTILYVLYVPGAYKEKHFVYLMSRLNDHASKWRTIGCYLGFSQGQLDNIESKLTLIPTGPRSFLCELLTQWIQRGNATLQALKFALNQAGLGVLSREIVIPP